jgi:hypothetical protein
VKSNAEKSPEEVATERSRVPGEETETKIESQTGSSGFSRFRIEEGFQDHRAQDDNSTSLVSSRTHVQPEEEDPVDEGAKAEGRSS